MHRTVVGGVVHVQKDGSELSEVIGEFEGGIGSRVEVHDGSYMKNVRQVVVGSSLVGFERPHDAPHRDDDWSYVSDRFDAARRVGGVGVLL